LAAAILLIAGGLLTATVNLAGLPVAFRAVGVLSALVGIAIALLAGKTRSRDPRFRRAAIALSLATVVIVGLMAVFAVIHVLSLLALLPLIAATVSITRPAAQTWFSEGAVE
jgi:membrane protease YdiL (CAAX protease family)